MKYKLGETRIIHWDLSTDFSINKNIDIIRRLVGADTYVAKEGFLPIIIECKIHIVRDGNILFTCIMHTKSLLQFIPYENPINDLMRMMEDAHSKENEKWALSPLSTIDISNLSVDQNIDLNKACEIRDIAIKQNLLTS
jgi:hypothetical protein